MVICAVQRIDISTGKLKILDAKVNVCSPGRNYVTLKLTTEDGIYGLGDATLNGRELTVASSLTDRVLPFLIGRDARRFEDIWQYLDKGAYWRRGPLTMSAIAAVDTALWDIKAKALNVPLYQLLGGASREAVLVTANASGADVEESVQAVARYLPINRKLDGPYTTGSLLSSESPWQKDGRPDDQWP